VESFVELRDLVKPVLTFAIAARYPSAPPMSDSLFWDTDEPYQYYRLFDAQTVILGGCDRPAEQVGGGASPHATLGSFLDARLAGRSELTHEWSGTLFETADGLPYVAEHPHHRGRVFVATGFGGNGMVLGTLAGRILADLATGSSNAHAPLFAFSRTGVAIRRPDEPSRAPTPAASGVPQFVRALNLADVTSAQPRAVTVNGRQIAFFLIDGAVHAIDNACSHAGGPLCKGKVDGTVVTCPWHGSRIDVTTGAVRSGPASRPQRRYAVRVNGEVLEVEV
jgi:nitrite reductase/ring-hydroxylating ferredoxin subunit